MIKLFIIAIIDHITPGKGENAAGAGSVPHRDVLFFVNRRYQSVISKSLLILCVHR